MTAPDVPSVGDRAYRYAICVLAVGVVAAWLSLMLYLAGWDEAALSVLLVNFAAVPVSAGFMATYWWASSRERRS